MTVEPGELRAVIGPNGAGKTTIFNMISGFLTPSSGPMLLSNFHVMCVDNGWHVGDSMAQPSRVDGGTCPASVVGTLQRAVLSSTVDGAVSSLSGRGYSCEIVDIGQVAGTNTATLGMAVRKRGRTTGLTYGIVDSISLTVNLDYGSIGMKTLTNQIGIRPDTTHNPAFGDHGDSGSAVVDTDRKIVGVHFAGSNDGHGIANPIADVLTALNVSVCTGMLKAPIKDVIDNKQHAKEFKLEKLEHKEKFEKFEIKEIEKIIPEGKGPVEKLTEGGKLSEGVVQPGVPSQPAIGAAKLHDVAKLSKEHIKVEIKEKDFKEAVKEIKEKDFKEKDLKDVIKEHVFDKVNIKSEFEKVQFENPKLTVEGGPKLSDGGEPFQPGSPVAQSAGAKSTDASLMKGGGLKLEATEKNFKSEHKDKESSKDNKELNKEAKDHKNENKEKTEHKDFKDNGKEDKDKDKEKEFKDGGKDSKEKEFKDVKDGKDKEGKEHEKLPDLMKFPFEGVSAGFVQAGGLAPAKLVETKLTDKVVEKPSKAEGKDKLELKDQKNEAKEGKVELKEHKNETKEQKNELKEHIKEKSETKDFKIEIKEHTKPEFEKLVPENQKQLVEGGQKFAEVGDPFQPGLPVGQGVQGAAAQAGAFKIKENIKSEIEKIKREKEIEKFKPEKEGKEIEKIKPEKEFAKDLHLDKHKVEFEKIVPENPKQLVDGGQKFFEGGDPFQPNLPIGQGVQGASGAAPQAGVGLKTHVDKAKPEKEIEKFHSDKFKWEKEFAKDFVADKSKVEFEKIVPENPKLLVEGGQKFFEGGDPFQPNLPVGQGLQGASAVPQAAKTKDFEKVGQEKGKIEIEKFKREKEIEKFKPEKEHKEKEVEKIQHEKFKFEKEVQFDKQKVEFEKLVPENPKQLVEGGPGFPSQPGGPIESRMSQLEAAVAQLSTFVTQAMRPDLSAGALTNEPDKKPKGPGGG